MSSVSEHGFSKAYRPELDGLRAVAVVFVLAFHVGFKPFSGGFIGVDVFFVISGYLITQILHSDCERERFSFPAFMARRIARLYPALVAVLFAVMVVGFVLFDPGLYRSLGLSTISAFFSASNLLFWQIAGYFDTSSALNPLLHTWSLAVEQQFYLVWPFLVVAVYRFRPAAVPSALMAAAAVSLALSEWFTVVDPSANYYLTPFRVFEFAVGGLLPWVERALKAGNAARELMLAMGLLLLGWALLAFDGNTAFPGVNAMVPVTGAALCILGGGAPYLGRVLRNRAVVFIGLISYSLYLVHWPIIVFYKYHVFHPLGALEKIGLFLAPFLFAVPLYYWVECKFRRVDLLSLAPKRRVLSLGLALLVLLPALGVFVGNGLGFRVSDRYQYIVNDPAARHAGQFGGDGYPLDGVLGEPAAGRSVAVFAGDSFALQYAAGMDEALKSRGEKIDTVFQHGCVLGPNITRLLNGTPRTECPQKTAQLLDLLEGNDLPLIYAISWPGYRDLLVRPGGQRLFFEDEASYGRALIAIIESVAATNPRRKLIILGSTPGVKAHAGVVHCLARPEWLPMQCRNALSLPVEVGLGRRLNQQLAQAFAHDARFLFLDPYDILCEEGICSAVQDGEVLYSDTSHLSVSGSALVSAAWLEKIGRFIQSPTERLP